MTPPEADITQAIDTGLIGTGVLARLLQTHHRTIKLVDATYPADPSLPGIADAATFDIDDIADPDAPFAHTLPSADIFAAKIGALGISNDDFVVVYDRSGFIMAASRVWWMFRAFGHDNIAVLDGGLEKWTQEGLPLTPKRGLPPARFTASFRPELVVDFDQVKEISQSGSRIILDARPPERFIHHIDGSKNIPALSLVSPERTLKSPSDFMNQLTANQIDINSPIITTCGSGVTACAVALALFREGKKDVAVYDGSWTEWSSR